MAGVPAAGRNGNVWWLVRHVQPYTAQAFATLALTTMAGLISTVDPLLMRYLIDRSLPSRRLLDSAFCVGLIAICFVTRPLLSGASGLLGFRVAQMIGVDLKSELLSHMSILSSDWHERTPLGEKLSRLDTDVDQIAQFGADAVNSIVRVVILFTVNLVIMLRLNVSMTLSVVPLLGVFCVVRWKFKSFIQANARFTQDSTGRAIGGIAEYLNAIPQLHLLGACEQRTAASVGIWLEVVAAQWKQRRTETAFSVSISMVLGLATLLVLGVGSYGFIAGTVTLGTIVAFYAYVSRIFEPLSTAMELYSRSQRMLASAHRILEVVRTDPTVRDSGKILAVATRLEDGVRLAAVSFQYRSDHWALRNINLHVEPGQSIAIVGPSGSGKSTLARLLVRFADPTDGSMIVENIPAIDYTLSALRQAICYVPQSPILFRGSIRENLLYANPSAGERQLERVLEVAQLDALVRHLPHGLDHMLDSGAAGLSGGEQQRLAVARALLRDSAVLVLDEATSALDVPTESALLREVRAFRPRTTIVIISHRLKSLTWVDRFILLNAGVIAAEGNHATLRRDSPLYRMLLDAEPEVPDPNPLGKPAKNYRGQDLHESSTIVQNRADPATQLV